MYIILFYPVLQNVAVRVVRTYDTVVAVDGTKSSKVFVSILLKNSFELLLRYYRAFLINKNLLFAV